jgi:hypothetical protein
VKKSGFKIIQNISGAKRIRENAKILGRFNKNSLVYLLRHFNFLALNLGLTIYLPLGYYWTNIGAYL